MFTFRRSSVLCCAVAVAAATLLAPTSAHAQDTFDVAVFDSITGASFAFTQETPRQYLGDKVNLQPPGGADQPVLLSRIDLILGHTAAADRDYNQVLVRLRLFNSGSFEGPVFTEPATDVLTFDITPQLRALRDDFDGPLTLIAGRGYSYSIALTNPILLQDGFNIGLGINYQADSGAGAVSSDELTSALRFGAPRAVGTSDFNEPFGGFLRDGRDGLPQRADFNFDQNDGSDLSSQNRQNAGLAFRLYTAVAVPEPSTMLLACSGMLALAGVVVRRRRSA